MTKKASDLAAEDDIREAFRVFDRDGNGHISRDEMKAVMMNIGKLGFESEIRVGHKVMECRFFFKKEFRHWTVESFSVKSANKLEFQKLFLANRLLAFIVKG